MTRHRARLCAAALAAFALTATGCATKADDSGDTTQGGVKAGPGVTEKEISLGVLSDLTGPFAASSKQQLAGAKLFWKAKNAEGGVCDRKVRLVVRDHHYDPQAAVSLYSEIEADILAVQMSVGAPTTSAIRPQLEQDDTLAVPMSFSPALLDSNVLIAPGTTYDVEMVNAVDYLVETGKVAKGDSIGYIYLKGEYGEPGYEGASFAAKQHGIRITGQQVDPTAADVSTQVSGLKRAGVGAILMSATPRQVASAAAVASAQGLDVPIVSAQPGWAPELLDTGAAKALTDSLTVVSSVAPFGSSAEGPAHLRELFEANQDDVPASWGMSFGYAVGDIMAQALTSACESEDLTREGLRTAFQEKGSFALNGTIGDLDYSEQGQSPSLKSFVLRPKPGVAGGLVEDRGGYTGPSVEGYLAQL
ncbi:MAG: ABC transporter substrate-binding protein [Nocardioidaceae bacterium]